jgi:Phage integrase family
MAPFSLPVQISRIVPVAARTGAREGELFALRAGDVDLADETLLVVSTGSNRRGRTKTRGSKRTIDLPPLAAQLLREQLLARWHTSSQLVFPAPEGGVWNKDNFTARVFRPAVQKVADRYRRQHRVASDELTPFDGLTFHDLRHTCASLRGSEPRGCGPGGHHQVDRRAARTHRRRRPCAPPLRPSVQGRAPPGCSRSRPIRASKRAQPPGAGHHSQVGTRHSNVGAHVWSGCATVAASPLARVARFRSGLRTREGKNRAIHA